MDHDALVQHMPVLPLLPDEPDHHSPMSVAKTLLVNASPDRNPVRDYSALEPADDLSMPMSTDSLISTELIGPDQPLINLCTRLASQY